MPRAQSSLRSCNKPLLDLTESHGSCPHGWVNKPSHHRDVFTRRDPPRKRKRRRAIHRRSPPADSAVRAQNMDSALPKAGPSSSQGCSKASSAVGRLRSCEAQLFHVSRRSYCRSEPYSPLFGHFSTRILTDLKRFQPDFDTTPSNHSCQATA